MGRIAYSEQQELLHDLKQPLNIIRLATANIRIRIIGELMGSDAAYLTSKLARIEEQVLRVTEILESLEAVLEPSAATSATPECTGRFGNLDISHG